MKKTLLFVFSTAVLFGSASSASAQNYQAQAARMVANQHMNNTLFMNSALRHTMAMGQSGYTLVNPISKYRVVMKDSTVKEIESKILFDEKNVSYLEIVDLKKKYKDPARVQKIYPADTRSITKVYSKNKLSVPGIASDSCWLFKSIEGKINGYTFLPVPLSSEAMNSGYFKFFQKGEGKLQILHTDSLKVMMQDNEKAQGQLKKDRPYWALLEYNKEVTPKK